MPNHFDERGETDCKMITAFGRRWIIFGWIAVKRNVAGQFVHNVRLVGHSQKFSAHFQRCPNLAAEIGRALNEILLLGGRLWSRGFLSLAADTEEDDRNSPDLYACLYMTHSVIECLHQLVRRHMPVPDSTWLDKHADTHSPKFGASNF